MTLAAAARTLTLLMPSLLVRGGAARPVRRALALGVFFLLAAPGYASSAEPTAQEKEAARSLMYAGDEARDRGDPAAALRAYLSADAIMHVPTTGLAVAKARAAASELVAARDKALEVARAPGAPGEPAVFAAARAEAATLAEGLTKRVATLHVLVEGVGAGIDPEISIDGSRVSAERAAAGWDVDPKPHVVAARAKDHRPAEARIALSEGENRTVRLSLSPDATAPPPADDGVRGTVVLAIAGYGVATAGIAVGSITGGLSLGQTGDLADACDGTRCAPDQADDISSATTLANVSNVAFIVAGVGLVVGVVGTVLSLDHDPPDGAPTASARGLAWRF